MALLEKLNPAQRTHSERDLLYSILLGTGGTLEKLPLSRRTYDARDLLYSILLNGIGGGGGGGAVSSVFGRADDVTAQNGDYSIGQITGAGTMASQNANAVAITGGTINGTVIGGGASAAGTFTTVSATTFTGNLLGNVGAGFAPTEIVSDSFYLNSGVLRVDSSSSIVFNGTSALFAGSANTIEQRNGTNAQAFHVYNTYTDGSNFERAYIKYDSNTLKIGHEYVGGSERSIEIGSTVGGMAGIKLWTDGSINFFTDQPTVSPWAISTSGHFVTGASNIDIGTAAGGKPRNIWMSGNLDAAFITASSGYIVGTSSAIRFDAKTILSSPVDGNLCITDSGATTFGLLQLGGTGSGEPAIKRSGAELHFRLANDGDYCHVHAKGYSVDGIAGISFAGPVANITVVNGIITNAS